MARAADAPVAPFGATRAGVTALVPEARLIAGDGPVPAGKYGVTEGQVDAWVDELSDSVALRLDGWERLTNVAVTEDVDGVTTVLIAGDRDRLVGHARTLVHNAAASYLEAARHPERANNVNDTSYAAVLWERYRAGLEDLVGWLEVRLAAPETGDTPEPAASAAAAYSFPAPLFGDALRF